MRNQTVVNVEDWDIRVNPYDETSQVKLLFQTEIEELQDYEEKSFRKVFLRVLKDLMKLKFIFLGGIFMLALIIWVSLKE